MDQAPAKPDPKVTQQVAQKATALKGVMGGKGSGAMVAKGLDKVAAGETLPKYYQSNSPVCSGHSSNTFKSSTNDQVQTVDETSTISINKINTTIN